MGFQNVHDGLRGFLGKLDFGRTEALGGVLEPDLGALEPGQALLYPLGATHRHADDFLLRHAEHDPALRGRGRVIKVDDRLPRADQRFEGALDQLLPRLHQHLQPDVIRRAVFLDEPAVEGELGVRGRGEADFDLLETTLNKRLKQFQLLADIHGDGQGLVAIPEVHAAPDRRVGEGAARPPAVGQVDRRERTIFDRRFFKHGCFAFWLTPPGGRGNKKPHRRLRQWGSEDLCGRLQPNCRASQQQRAR